MFIAADLEKVEVKHQNLQTEAVEVKDQQVQTETIITQEKGVLPLRLDQLLSCLFYVHNSEMHEKLQPEVFGECYKEGNEQ